MNKKNKNVEKPIERVVSCDEFAEQLGLETIYRGRNDIVISDISVSEMVSDEMKDAGYNVSLSDNQINELLKSDADISKEISTLHRSNSK